MKLPFLWDEEKTRKLFQTHLILFFIGGIVAIAYTFLLPINTPYRLIINAVPILFTISCLIFFFTMHLPNPGIRLLIFTLIAQTAASVFMAVTGGFLGIVQFAPIMFLLFTLFELGPEATVILGIYSIFTFFGILIWTTLFSPEPNGLQHFLYFTISYALILYVERNIGKEISIQIEAKKQLQKIDDLKNQFMALTSHHLRTPLSIIKGYLSVLEKELESSQQKEDLNKVKVGTEQLEHVMAKFLVISSISGGETKVSIPSDLNKLLFQIVEGFKVYAEREQVALSYQPSAQPIIIKMDPVRLNEAIAGLLENAIKFNKPLGKVIVSAEVDQKWVKISVVDNGIGIKQENLETIFSAFNRGDISQTLEFNKPGIGLGLYLAKLIVEAHHGKIEASSKLGEGSTFTITLPIT